MSTNIESENQQKMPAVPHVYEWLEMLYEIVERRYVAVDARIQNLVAFAASTFVAVVALMTAGSKPITLDGFLLVAAILVAVQVLVGLWGLAWGHISLFGLNHIVTHELELNEYEFKRTALGWANQDLAATRRVVNIKGWIVWSLVAALILELSSLYFWLATIDP